MPFVNPYTELGLTEDAADADIRRCRKEAAKQHHPDRFQDVSADVRAGHEEQLKHVNELCDLLLNPAQRRRIDETLAARRAAADQAAAARARAEATRRSRAEAAQRATRRQASYRDAFNQGSSQSTASSTGSGRPTAGPPPRSSGTPRAGSTTSTGTPRRPSPPPRPPPQKPSPPPRRPPPPPPRKPGAGAAAARRPSPQRARATTPRPRTGRNVGIGLGVLAASGAIVALVTALIGGPDLSAVAGTWTGRVTREPYGENYTVTVTLPSKNQIEAGKLGQYTFSTDAGHKCSGTLRDTDTTGDTFHFAGRETNLNFANAEARKRTPCYAPNPADTETNLQQFTVKDRKLHWSFTGRELGPDPASGSGQVIVRESHDISTLGRTGDGPSG